MSLLLHVLRDMSVVTFLQDCLHLLYILPALSAVKYNLSRAAIILAVLAFYGIAPRDEDSTLKLVCFLVWVFVLDVGYAATLGQPKHILNVAEYLRDVKTRCRLSSDWFEWIELNRVHFTAECAAKIHRATKAAMERGGIISVVSVDFCNPYFSDGTQFPDTPKAKKCLGALFAQFETEGWHVGVRAFKRIEGFDHYETGITVEFRLEAPIERPGNTYDLLLSQKLDQN